MSRKFYLSRFSWIALTCLSLLAPVALAHPDQPADHTAAQKEAEEAAGNLVVVSLPARLAPINKMEVRLSDQAGKLIVSEILEFAPPQPAMLPATGRVSNFDDEPAPVIELLSTLAETRQRLALQSAEGRRLKVEIDLNGARVFDDSFDQLLALSQELFAGPLQPVSLRSESLDLEAGDSGAEVSLRGACEVACYGEESNCAQQYCSGSNYDWYMCNYGCTDIRDRCLQDCADGIEPPTCTVGVIGTTSSTTLFSTTNLGNQCLLDWATPFPNHGHWFSRLRKTYQTITRDRWQNSDCTVYLINPRTTYFDDFCFQNTYSDCFGAFAYPGGTC